MSDSDKTTNPWRTATRLLVAGTALLWAVYDVFAYSRGGNDATISKVAYDAAREWPIVAVAAGVLVGHFFWPQTRARE